MLRDGAKKEELISAVGHYPSKMETEVWVLVGVASAMVGCFLLVFAGYVACFARHLSCSCRASATCTEQESSGEVDGEQDSAMSSVIFDLQSGGSTEDDEERPEKPAAFSEISNDTPAVLEVEPSLVQSYLDQLLAIVSCLLFFVPLIHLENFRCPTYPCAQFLTGSVFAFSGVLFFFFFFFKFGQFSHSPVVLFLFLQRVCFCGCFGIFE